MPSNTQFVEHVLANTHPDRVYTVEDGRVWVSGMNANCRRVAEDMARSLSDRGVPCGLVRDDDAARNSGVCFTFGDSDDLEGHHAVGDPNRAAPRPPDDDIGVLVALAAVAIVAFVVGLSVGWVV